MRSRAPVLLVTAFLALGLPLRGQEGPSRDSQAAGRDSEVPLALNLPTADHLADWDIGLRFTHRFQEPANSGSHELFGLDGGAYSAFGFDFGIKAVPGLNAGIYRTADQKTLTFALQEQLWDNAQWRGAFRVERYDEVVPGGTSGVALQLPLEWRPWAPLTLEAVPTWLSRTPTEKGVANVGLGLRWDLAEHHGVYAEYYPRPSKIPDSFHRGCALGYVFRTYRHRFTILATNEPGTTAHQVLGGDYDGSGPVRLHDWALGFNLVRIF